MNGDRSDIGERLAALEAEVANLKRLVESGRAEPPPAPAGPAAPAGSVPPAPHALMPRPAPRPSADEVTLVGPWLARIGAVALVIGAAFAFKYAIDRGLIGPTGRVVLGIVAGAALVVAGEWARRRGWPGWAQAVSGGAIGLWYLAVWAAYQLYALIPAPVALVGFTLISLAGVGLALRHDSEPLAVLATATAFLNPFLVGTLRTAPVDAYVLAIDAGVLIIAAVRPWPSLVRVAVLGTWISASFVAADAGLGIPLAFGTVFFAIFFGHALWRARTVPDLVDSLFGNSFFYLAYGLVLVEAHADAWSGAFAAGLGVVHLAAGMLAARRLGAASRLPLVLLLLGGGFLVLAVPLQFEGPLVPAVWAVQAVALVGLGVRGGSRFSVFAGVGLLVVSILQALAIEFAYGADYRPDRLLLSGESAVLALQIASTGLVARLIMRGDARDRGAARLAQVGAHVFTLIWLTLEVVAHFARIGEIAAPFPGAPAGFDPAFLEERAFTITTVWALYGVGLLVAGIATRSLTSRLVAVGVFGAVLLKLIAYDLWLIGPLYRTIAFIGLGVLLLLSSLLYHRFTDLILGDRSRETT